MTETVLEHFHIAEYKGSDFSKRVPGHFYSYHNDPVGHDNHVHLAEDPAWGEPDAAHGTPKLTTVPTAGISELTRWYFRTDDLTIQGAPIKPNPRVKGTAWGGTVVRKHRNSDPDQPWSQHTFGNALDIMADHAQADAVIALLNGPYEEEDEDMTVTNDDYEQRAFTWGQLQRWQGKPMPTKSPDLNPAKSDENFLDPAQRGWKQADGQQPPPVKA